MTRTYWVVAILMVVAAWAASAAMAPRLPATVATHWNIHGKVDAHGPKAMNLVILPAVMTGMLGFFWLLPALSPKPFEVDSFRSTYLYLMVLVIGLFGYMHGLLLYASATGHVAIWRAFIAGAFLVFALLGNVMGKVRRNFYIGVRVPWTLASDRVWNDTHRLAAWLMVAGGLLGFVIVIAGLPIVAAVAVLIVALVVPVVYSFVHYKQLERRDAL
jgi:uncharacterized membrane protein